MDPTQTWYDLMDAHREGRREDREELREALAGWLTRGGFYPRDWPPEAVDAFLDFLKQKKGNVRMSQRFHHKGRVIRSVILAGSYRTVTLDNGREYCLGLGRGNTHPRRGDRIIVTGLEKNGRILAEDWDFV